MRALILAATLFATPVLAQGAQVWTPAPVPGTTRSDGPPADRAGTSNSADQSAPFAGLPTGALSTQGQNTGGSLPPTGPAAGVPNTPNVSR